MNVDAIIDGIIQREGGYADNPADKGGATKYGITEAVARAHGYTGAMQDLPVDFARGVYRYTYYIAPGFAQVAAASLPLVSRACNSLWQD